MPLLDEAAELLGDDGAEAAARPRPRRCARRCCTPRACWTSLDLEEDLDPELLRATDVVDADRLAERQRMRRYDSTAERAAADREWTYGHVIVDEAQELSPMAWRLLMRRCPSRSMTVVGDIAQTGDLAGAVVLGRGALARTWPDRWRLEQLTVNYRTPAEIADVADDVLAAIDPRLTPPQVGAQHRGAAAGGPGRRRPPPGRRGGQGAGRGGRRGGRGPHRGAGPGRPGGRAAGTAARRAPGRPARTPRTARPTRTWT